MLEDNKLNVLIYFALSLLSFVTNAHVSSITIACSVRSFDSSSFACAAEGYVYTLSRSFLNAKQLRSGESVLVTVPGEKVATVLNTAKPL